MLKIITMGTGNAFAHEKSFQSAHYIEIDGKKIMLDCGPAILSAAQHSDVDVSDLEYLFISHLHGDHMSGVPFLLLNYKYVIHRKSPLTIIGPKGLRDQIDFAIRGSYPSLITEDLYKVIELHVNQEFKIYDHILVRPFEAYHIPDSFCYSISLGNLKVVYSGDNELQEGQLIEFDSTTVLIHELTTMDSTQGGHTSWELMKKYLDNILSKTKYVLLVHTSEDVRNEPNQTFPRNVIRAKDGSIFEFNERGNLFQMVI